MLLYFFLVITSFWILKPLKKSLFVRFYDTSGFHVAGIALDAAQTELLAKVANLVVAGVAVAIFSLLAQRLRRQALSLLFTGFFAFGYLAFRVLLPDAGAGTVWSFYLFGDLFSTLMVATFFAFLNDSVDADAARRLYGLIGLGGVLGGVVGSSVLSVWIDALDVEEWLWVCLGLAAAIAAAALGAAHRSHRLPSHARPRKSADATRGDERFGGFDAAWRGARLVARSRYLLSIVCIVALYEVASTLMDFQFTSTVAHYLDGEAIGRQFSRVFALTNAASVAVQVFLTGWMMRRFGVGSALLVLPAAIFAGSTAFLAVPTLWPGSLLNTADNAFSYSINQSAKEALYVPTGTEEKYHAKAFIDMFVQRLAKTVAVGMSLAITARFTDFATVRWLSLLTGALLLVWLPAVRYAGRHFRELASDETGAR